MGPAGASFFQRTGRAWFIAFDVALAAGAAWVLLWLLLTWWSRVDYPFDLEWMEGSMLVLAQRVRHGLPIYAPPSADFVPYLYPPLYTWILSLLGEPSYVLGRTLSLVGVLAAASAIVYALRGERASWGLSLGTAALFLTCYDESGGYFDLVRVDGVSVGLLAWAVVLCRRGSTSLVACGGLLLALAFGAKQNDAIFGVPVALWLLKFGDLRRCLLFVACAALPALLLVVVEQVTTHGDFLKCLVGVPMSHPRHWERAWSEGVLGLWNALPWVFGAALATIPLWLRRWRAGGIYWLGIGIVGLWVSVFMRVHHGGFKNVLMPGFWALALCAGVALAAAWRRFSHPLMGTAITLLVLIQLRSGLWEIDHYAPTEADLKAGLRVLQVMKELPGDVFAPEFPWYPTMVGKKPSPSLIALWDVDHAGGPYEGASKPMKEALAAHRWSAVITSSAPFLYSLAPYYRKARSLDLPDRALFPRTGWQARPDWLWLPAEGGGAPTNTPRLPPGEQPELE